MARDGVPGAKALTAQPQTRRPDTRRIASVWLAIPVGLILFAAKDAVLSVAASPMPFMDEWDGAYDALIPLLQGRSPFERLFVTHNEHRFVFTRLLMLAIYEASGYYDVVLQMIVNAAIRSATVAWIVVVLSRQLPIAPAIAAIAIGTLLNAVPFDWDNTLLGFNTHFPLLLTLSFGSLVCLANARAFSIAWTGGVTLALLSFLTLASGALTLGAAAALAAVQVATGCRKGIHEIAGVAVQLVLMAALIGLVLRIPANDVLRAGGVLDFVRAMGELLSWPAPSPAGLLLAAPAMVYGVRFVMRRPPLSHPGWLLVATYGWVTTQFAALAIVRSHMPVMSRYLDINLIGVSVNVVCILLLAREYSKWPRWRAGVAIVVAIWIVGLGAATRFGARDLTTLIGLRQQAAAAQTTNVLGYLATRDTSYLEKKNSTGESVSTPGPFAKPAGRPRPPRRAAARSQPAGAAKAGS